MVLKGKNIVLAVSGGIAAYKVVQVARDLTKEGAEVHVLMSEAATRFVTPLTFQTLTQQKVHTQIWEGWTKEEQGHISLPGHADLILLAPATANTMAKLAHGLADDLISTAYLATPTTTPFMVVPAMEHLMFVHPATQQNIQTLRDRGVIVLDPKYGEHATGATGLGRMPEPTEIVAAVRLVLGQRQGDLRGKRVVVTAGGTQEPIDPVRFIGNGSSGQMGYALAQQALERGAKVTLISGPVKLEPPYGCEFVSVRTTREMEAAVNLALEANPPTDVLIMAAAVADFRPLRPSEQKIKKEKDKPTPVIELELNPDILLGLKGRPGLENLLRVGFAAETNDLALNAEKKLKDKDLDLIVANEAISSIGQPDNEVTLIERGGLTQQLARKPKRAVATAILDKVLELLEKKHVMNNA
ncbi:MAG: bifunctional phosphopantothenoylcysteine decarboxylase/phosphopantothenate--cysteine ligase CoaBC [Chloroflexota bacterium]